MDEKQQEFDIEDIIREFGSGSADREETPAEAEAPAAEVPEMAQEEISTEAEPPEEASVEESSAEEEPTEEILENAPIEESPAGKESTEEAAEEAAEEAPAPAANAMGGDTVRIEVIPDVKGSVREAEHIDDQDEPITPPEIPRKAEPYSEQWEPEYEQPMAEYVPPKPITFRPKERMRELKKQLVEGPEQEYYRLAEKGLGKLQLGIAVCLLAVLLSAVTTIAFNTDTMLAGRLKFMIFSQFFVMLLAATIGSFQLIDGFLAVCRGKFNLNSMLLASFILCTVDGLLCFQQLRVPCCAAFSLLVTIALWSTYQSRNVRMGQLDTLRKATRLDGLFPVEWDDQVYLVRGQGKVEHFDNTDKDIPRQEKLLNIYALIALGVSIGAGVLAGVLHGFDHAVQVAAVTTLAATPAAMLICIRRPMGILERRMHKLGTVLCGWEGAKNLTGPQLFPIDHEDLFPVGTVKLNGVKFFGDRQPDQVIAYAAALITRESGTLNPIFTQLLDSRNGIHYDPTEFRFYEGGIGGIVNGEPVLVGSLELLKEMGVEVPEGIRVSQAVCVSVDGELSGLFAITYDLTRSAAYGLDTLCRYRNLKPVIVSRDFMLTPSFIREHFGVNPKRILFPEMEERYALSQLKAEEDAQAAALITGEGLSCFAFPVTGARSIRSGLTMGVVIQLVGGILGIAMMFALAYLGAFWLLTPAKLFLYELVWLVPGILITEWTRSV